MAGVPRNGIGFNPGVAIDSNTTGYTANTAGNWLLAFTADSSTVPSTKPGFAVGCLLVTLNDLYAYKNSGSVTSCTFTAKVTFA